MLHMRIINLVYTRPWPVTRYEASAQYTTRDHNSLSQLGLGF